MAPTDAELSALVHSLLENARSLGSDARLLHANGRFARCYALAALAGEELGKIAYCLDGLLGDDPPPDKKFRRSWQSHIEKLSGLVAYQAAFVEEATSVDTTALRERSQTIARRKMEAIYVDTDATGVVTPASVTEEEATELLEGVEAAVTHAARMLGGMSSEVVAAANAVAPLLSPLLDEYLARLSPEEAIRVLRDLTTRLPTLSVDHWVAAIEEDRVPQLLGLA